jgi:hypothetical protein
MTVDTRVQTTRVREVSEPAPHFDSRMFWAWVWESIYPVLGWILIGAGTIVIALAWWGVSRNAIVAKQLPYLASGGIGGLALITLGGRVMMIRDLRRDSGRLDRLEHMVLELHDVLLERADAAGFTAAHGESAAGGRTTEATSVFALPRGNRYHRASCRVLANKSDVIAVTPAVRKKRNLVPCPLCEPDADAA